MTFFVILKKIENLDEIFSSSKFQILNPEVGGYQSTLKGYGN